MYFGDQQAPERCGHCSVCQNGAVSFQSQQKHSSLSSMDFESLTHEFKLAIGNSMTANNTAKYLCGIHTPIFTRLKVRSLPHFGILEQQPFQAVKTWLNDYIDKT